ncbi:MAG: hypothetical protein AB8G05_22125 [Oligoflexales bacterium]
MLRSVFLVVLIFFVACAHYPDVRPGTDRHTVLVYEDNENAAFRNAMSQAKDYCDSAEGGKRPIVIKENKIDKGSIGKLVDGVAKMLDSKEQGKSISSMAGINADKPYEVTLIFKCK